MRTDSFFYKVWANPTWCFFHDLYPQFVLALLCLDQSIRGLFISRLRCAVLLFLGHFIFPHISVFPLFFSHCILLFPLLVIRFVLDSFLAAFLIPFLHNYPTLENVPSCVFLILPLSPACCCLGSMYICHNFFLPFSYFLLLFLFFFCTR